MQNYRKTTCFHYFWLVALVGAVACSATAKPEVPIKVAVMPDIHFHDVYGEFRDQAFKGVHNPLNGKAATIRTMAAQLGSTRLLNENYFALLAALDDAVAKGIPYIVFPGDFSDNGQPLHVRGLEKILHQYRQQHGLRFFAAMGNHDPVRPLGRAAGADDFLGEQGQSQAIYSLGTEQCRFQNNKKATSEAVPICSDELQEWGYGELMSELADTGFFPQTGDIYWETPYSLYDVDDYRYQEALIQASLEQRQYEICLEGSRAGELNEAESAYTLCSRVPDSSYLVEPEAGLWLLAIDANVYIPRYKDKTGTTVFAGASNAGYNKILSHKKHLVRWIEDVARRAKAFNKRLLAFSHFPMIEFYDDRSDLIASVFGDTAMQLRRRPTEDVSRALAETGLRWHVAGHMHINDTGVRRYSDDNYLINIQVPSIAAYIPSYKVLTLHGGEQVEINTVVLEQVSGFDELFPLYRQEHDYLKRNGLTLWDESILNSKSYREFTDAHLRALVRQRFLKADWPDTLRQQFFQFSGLEFLAFALFKSPLPPDDLTAEDFISWMKSQPTWQQALGSLRTLAEAEQLDVESFRQWRAEDFAIDLYRLRNAGQLAVKEIGVQRLQQYHFVARMMKNRHNKKPSGYPPGLSVYYEHLSKMTHIFDILVGLSQGAPSEHVLLDLKTGRLLNPWLPCER